MAIHFTLNGKPETVSVNPDMPLLWVLRDTLNMTGTKFGCGMALCGACTVHVNGDAIRSCITPISAMAGKTVVTIEGLSATSSHPVQRAWVEIDVPQCGYCQSGQIMSASALLAKTPKPTDAQIDDAMTGNICRCGTYPRIKKAIHRAAELQAASAKPSSASADPVPIYRRCAGRRCGMSAITNPLDRRSFLKTGLAGATGLVIGFYLPGKREVLAAAAPDAPQVMNAFIQITPDDKVTILINKSEMGQGVETSLAMLAAEELGCDWKRIHTEFAPAATVYFDPAFGMQGTGGSQSIHSAWIPMRQAGFTARTMLIAAAAQNWGVDASECHAADGKVIHAASKRTATFGSLAEAAAKIPPPQVKPQDLKDPSMFTIVGKPTKRVDTPKKVNGTAGFGVDVRLPGMLHASVEHCPVFGGTVVSFDATKAKAISGVKDVVPIMTVKDPKKPPVMTGVAVVADNTWTAFQGRKALEIKWDEGAGADASTASIRKSFEDVMSKPGVVSRKEGDVDAGAKAAATTVEAVYWAPYQAHSTMEPMNGTADVRADGVDLWMPTQFQTPSQMTGAGISGLKPDQVKVHTTYLGGGFGRRGWSDFVAESTQLSKAMGKPVQVTWTREDDTQHDYYRPASLIKMSAGLDSSGKPTAFTARVACDSIMSWFFPGSITNGLDS